MAKYIYIVLLLFLLSCETQERADIRVESKQFGRDNYGIFYMDIKLRNHGEQPASFVTVIAEPVEKGEVLDRIEYGIGDIFPGKSEESRIKFPDIGFAQPDDVLTEVTYNAYAQ